MGAPMKTPAALSLIILACLAGFFYFQGLDHWYLWQDEANSALLSKNILTWGYPFVFDGKNAIWPSISDVSSTHHYWVLWGWLPLYVQALSFKIFGVSTFSARFPSALMGWAFAVGVFLFARIRKCSVFQSLLFPMLFIFCIPLTLFFRQCGYYAFTMVLSGSMYFALFERKEGKGRSLLFFILSTCLVNVHMLIWGVVMGGLFFASVLEPIRKPFLKLLSGAALLALPFLFLYEAWTLFGVYGSESSGDATSAYWKRLCFFEENLCLVFFPKWFLMLFGFCAVYFWTYFEVPEKKRLKQVSIFVGTGFLLVPFLSTQFLFFRYVLFTIPFFLFAICVIQWRIWKYSKIWGSVLGAALAFNNGVGYQVPAPPQEPFLQSFYFFYELTHDGEDLNEVLCQFLNKNAKPKDTVFCSYGEFPIQFYTDLLVRGGAGHIGISSEKTFPEKGISKVDSPDWIVDRTYWDWMYPKNAIDAYLKQNLYEKIILPVEETAWGNRPFLPFHFFATPMVMRPLVIYRKKQTPRTP